MTDNILLKSAKKEKEEWIGLFPFIGEVFSDLIGWTVKGLWDVIAFLFGPQNRKEISGNDGLYLKATVISVCLSLFLAGVSFYGSFTAASRYAEAHGIAEGVSIWVPIAIDGFVLLGVLVVFGASLVGERVGWVRFLIFAFAVVSVIFNVAHILETNAEKVESPEALVLEPQHILLGAIFPLIVFLASEVTSKQISAYIERKSSLMTNQSLIAEIAARIEEKRHLIQEIETKRQKMLIEAEASIRTELEALESRRDSLISEIDRAENRLGELSQQEGEVFSANHLKTAYLWGQTPDLKGRQVKEELDVSVAWGNRLKREVAPVLFNGNGTNHD